MILWHKILLCVFNPSENALFSLGFTDSVEQGNEITAADFLVLFFPFQSDPAAVKATLAVIIGSSLQNKEMEFETPFVQSGLQSREAL